MADGTFPLPVSADGDLNAATNPIYTQLTDGTETASVNASNELNVAIGSVGVGAGDLGKAEDAPHASGDVGVMALAVRQDTQADFGADGDYVPLSIDANGALRTSAQLSVGQPDDDPFAVGTDDVVPTGYLFDDVSTDTLDEGDVGIPRVDGSRRVLTRLVGSTDSQRLEINANNRAEIDIAEQTLTALAVSADNTANSASNPLYVHNVAAVASGSEVHNYKQAVAVAGAGTDDHTYAVVNTTFFLKAVDYASSGASKWEIAHGEPASEATVAVRFLPRFGGGSQICFAPSVEVAKGTAGQVLVTGTNRQGQAQDLYSTIIGNDE